MVRIAISTGSSMDLSLRKTVVGCGSQLPDSSLKDTHKECVSLCFTQLKKSPGHDQFLKAFNGTGINCISLRQGITLGWDSNRQTWKPGKVVGKRKYMWVQSLLKALTYTVESRSHIHAQSRLCIQKGP